MDIAEDDQLKDIVDESQSAGMNGTIEDHNVRDSHGTDLVPVVENGQDANQEGWLEWQEVRQSK